MDFRCTTRPRRRPLASLGRTIETTTWCEMTQAAGIKAEVANPFRPGNGVAPPYLAGRDRLLVEFEAFVDEQPLHPNWTLTGLRGTGKTVLVNEFAARAERAGWLTLERELSERHRDDNRLADAIDEDVDALIRRIDLVSGIGQRIEQSWRYLRPRRVSIGDVAVEPSYESQKTSPQDRMKAAFAELDASLSEREAEGAILFYDEAHLLADDRSRERFPLSGLLSALGAVQRVEPRVRIVLCGLPTLSLNLKRARTYAERMFRHLVVANLERGDAWDAIQRPLSHTSRDIATSVVGEIVEQTAGYPYFLQFFGAYLCRSVSTSSVSMADYTAVEPALLHELDLAFFDDRFEGASPTEQLVLDAMARQGGRCRLAELRRRLPDLAGQDVLLRRLTDRGLVYRATRGTYDFALPLFRDYLRRRPSHLTERTRPVSSVGPGMTVPDDGDP